MWTKAELIQLLVAVREHNVDALRRTPKAKPVPGTQEWYHQLPKPAANTGISMNEMARGIPKPKPPRRPSLERR